MKKIITISIIFGFCFSECVAAHKQSIKCAEKRIATLPEDSDILFTSDRDSKSRCKEIYAFDIDSGKVTRITHTKEHHFILGIDRSRRYIVTSRVEKDTDLPKGLGDEDRRALWLLDLESKHETRLTDARHHAEGDSFSPDGEWIAFHMRLAGKKNSDIYKIRRDGTDLTQLTNTPHAIEGDPAWSNSGKEIAFAYLDGKTRRFILKKMDINGGNIRTIYDGGEGVSTPAFPPGNYDPSWSPDDRWLVSERAIKSKGENWGSGVWHIFKVRSDGSETLDLSMEGNHPESAEYLPSYSPDGRHIIFGSLYQAKDPKESHNDIFIMDANGNIVKRLTSHPKSDMFPVWIPAKGRK